MTAPARWSAEVTPALLDRAEPQLAALLWWADERAYAARITARRRVLAVARWGGLAVAIAGILLASWLIVVTPDAPCTAARLRRYHLYSVFCVLAAILFGFQPRLTVALRGWVRRQLGEVARRSLRLARRHAPYTAEWEASERAIAVKVPWAKPAATDLARVRSAAVAPGVACLYRRPGLRGLARILVLADDAARATVVDALRRAGADIVEVPVRADPA